MIRNNDANYYGNFGKINGIGTNGYNQNNINRNININNINPNLPNMMNNKDNNSFFRNSGQRKNITNNIDDNYYMYGFGNNSQSRPMNNQPVRLNQLRDFNNNADYYSNYNNQLRSDINSDNVENMGFSNQIIYNNMNSQNNMSDFFGNNNNYNNINYYNFDSNNQIMNSKSNNNSNMNSNNNYNKNPQTVNPFINDNNGYFICNNNCKQNSQAINAFNSNNNNFNNNINNNSNFNNNNFTYNNNYNYNNSNPTNNANSFYNNYNINKNGNYNNMNSYSFNNNSNFNNNLFLNPQTVLNSNNLNNNFNYNNNQNYIQNNVNNIYNNNDINIFNSKTTINKPKNDYIELNFMIRARGLENVGATCYMNAPLQCLYHIKPLSENILNDDKINKSMELTYCFKKLIEKLAGCENRRRFRIDIANYTYNEKKKDYVKPQEFKDLIGRKNDLFKGINANDSKDLIIFLLEGMDKELTIRNNKTTEIEKFYGNNINEMSETNFKKIHNSIFGDLFYGFQRSFMECLSCKHIEQTFSVFNFMIFPLEKIFNSLNKKKNMNMNNNMNKIYSIYNFQSFPNDLNILNPCTVVNKTNYNLNKLNLKDCFKDNENEEILSGENKIYCNNCNKYSDARTKNDIYKAPKVLILILNRGKGNSFKCDVDFEKELDISSFVSNPNNSPTKYNLIGVICHLGESSMNGHFLAYCKHFDDNWYLFNDGIVTSEGEAKKYKGIPYILFYQSQVIN